MPDWMGSFITAHSIFLVIFKGESHEAIIFNDSFIFHCHVSGSGKRFAFNCSSRSFGASHSNEYADEYSDPYLNENSYQYADQYCHNHANEHAY